MPAGGSMPCQGVIHLATLRILIKKSIVVLHILSSGSTLGFEAGAPLQKHAACHLLSSCHLNSVLQLTHIISIS